MLFQKGFRVARVNIEKLNKWADLLLDTGKRNNLVNFKDSKTSSVEIVFPDFQKVFSKALRSFCFEVYDPKLNDDDDLFIDIPKSKIPSKEEYIQTFSSKIKASQILVYSISGNPLQTLKSIGRKGISAIEETGVNIVYLAVGFIRWKESSDLSTEMLAPLLLLPVTIEHESTISPYRVKVSGDEIAINPSFAYKLQNEHGIVLPEFDEDEGIDLYLTKISSLLSPLNWTISKEAKIGIFSFQKINMYKDLKENTEVIAENENVRILLGEPNAPTSEESEAPVDLLSLHNVIDADSSQAEAIEAAKEGKSFVLQGPPGTGKSQTITNIIAECLMDGKKVLFVSEKLAALNVVYDKLKKVDLAEFCLELHSHKANKKQVVEELCATLHLPRSGVSSRAEKEINLKEESQHNLDAYVTELHQVRPTIHRSLYQLFEEISACRNFPDITFLISNLPTKGEYYLDQAEKDLTHYAEYTKTIGSNYRRNVWYGYVDSELSFAKSVQLKGNLQGVAALLRDLKSLNPDLKKSYGIGMDSLKSAKALETFFDLCSRTDFITPGLFNEDVLDQTIGTAKSLETLAQKILSQKESLDQRFDEDIFSVDGKRQYKLLSKQYQGFFSRLFSKEYKGIIKELRLTKKDGKKPNYQEAVQIVDELQKYQEDLASFKEQETDVIGLFGKGYQKEYTDFDTLLLELESLQGCLKEAKDIRELSYMPLDHFLAQKVQFRRYADKLSFINKSHEECLASLLCSFDVNKVNLCSLPFDELGEKLNAYLDNLGTLEHWCSFLKLLNTLKEHELLDYVNFALSQGIPAKDVALVFRKTLYTQWVDSILHDSPVLSDLTRIPHDEMVERFKEKDRVYFEINKAKIKAELSSKRPSLDYVAQGSAVATLLREGEKKRKRKEIRQLFAETGDLVLALKPCFLMSPLSVSTFLSPEIKFDVVIFDEASQIFPQDAVGAIYRGKQLIVVGDSKQMPPSNFFNVEMSDANEEEESIADYESILDLCSTSFAQRRLAWHYRSRYEPLISFSNANFYHNGLVTFPSSKTNKKRIGVDFEFVNGVFDRVSKTNRIEAERIVDLVFEHINTYPERSLGVVAFSISQQNLIERLIYRRRKQHPEHEEFFVSSRPEPFFVKNLETVQGDERDTIIFSVAYAKDADGRLLYNFGPLNREGGERRLNVAVTRAKINIQLVASIHHFDIDTNRTKSLGAKLLRDYLGYAENGTIGLTSDPGEVSNAFEMSQTDFENEVAEFLREHHFEVDTNVGSSADKVDLAIKNPNSSDYILAIECDGQTYRSSKTARDRDRLRQEVLERMGWTFYRLWSTDWFRDKETEKQRLLKAAISAAKGLPTQPKEPEPPEDVDFEETIDKKKVEFPKYEMVDAYDAALKNHNDVLLTVKAIVDVESPISEEWLLKRIVFLFDGRKKVTNLVRGAYEHFMFDCFRYGIGRKNGYLYTLGQDTPMLRVPKEGTTPREIKYIALEELASGIEELLKQNISANRGDLFRLLASLLGFTRIGEGMQERFNAALSLMSDKLEQNGETVSLKNKKA